MAYVLHLSATSATTADESSRNVVQVKVECSNRSWYVTKTLGEVVSLLSLFPELVSCSPTDEPSVLTEKLAFVYKSLAENAWERPEAVYFIRDISQVSIVGDLQALHVKTKMDRLEKQLFEHQQILAEYAQQQKDMAELVLALTKQVQDKHNHSSNNSNSSSANSNSNSKRSVSSATDNSPEIVAAFTSLEARKDINGIIQPPLQIRDYRSSDEELSTNDSSSRNTRPSSSGGSTEYPSGGGDGGHETSVSTNSLFNDRKSGSDVTDPSHTDSSIIGATAEDLKKLFSNDEDVLAVHVPNHLKTISAMLDSIRPHESQLKFRRSAAGLVMKSVRQILTVNTFDVSYCDIHSFLPDDPIKLSVVISRAQSTTWQKPLIERLRLYSADNGSGVSALYSSAGDSETSAALIPEEYQVVLPHTLSNIESTSKDMKLSVGCTVDDSLEVLITTNNRHDLCELSFVEEFNSLIQNNDLFKRSLLLVRAWWTYEATTYVGCPVKHYLTDNVILIMLCSVFNRLHKKIASPVQALCVFLAEYSTYDGANQAISIQGICSFATPSSTQPILLPVEASHILTREAIDKYLHVFNPQSSNASGNGSEDSSYAYGGRVQQSGGIMPKNRYSGGSCSASSPKFERHSFNVVHPFTGENMIAQKLSTNRMGKLRVIFQTAFTNFVAMLKQPDDLCGVCFKSTMARFKSSWRPDAIGNSIKSLDGHESLLAPLTVTSAAMDRIWQNIVYFDMVLESIVTEQALLTLCIEILALKGALPVGEIGKTLADMTNIANLSVKLKEKFGGLKKFLERFTDIFIFSNEHPFNPHVLLKSTLSREHADMIDRGIFPSQLIAKSRKGGNGAIANSGSSKSQQQQQQQQQQLGPSPSCRSTELAPALSRQLQPQQQQYQQQQQQQQTQQTHYHASYTQQTTDIDFFTDDSNTGDGDASGRYLYSNINVAPQQKETVNNGFNHFAKQQLPRYGDNDTISISSISSGNSAFNAGRVLQQQHQPYAAPQIDPSVQGSNSGNGNRALPMRRQEYLPQGLCDFTNYSTGGSTPHAGNGGGRFVGSSYASAPQMFGVHGNTTNNNYYDNSNNRNNNNNNNNNKQQQQQHFPVDEYYGRQGPHQQQQHHHHQQQQHQSSFSGYSHF